MWKRQTQALQFSLENLPFYQGGWDTEMRQNSAEPGKEEKVVKNKHIPFLMAMLMPIFMFSIGFSSWTLFGSQGSIETGGSFEVYEVDEYLSWASTEMFEYTSLYFIDTDNASYNLGDPNVGKIKVTFNFTQLAKTMAQESDGLTVKFALRCKNLKQVDGADPNIFTPTNTSACVNGDDQVISQANSVFEFSHNFKGDIGDSVTVTYTFTTNVGKDFRAEFGQYFLNEYGADKLTTEFVASAEAEVTG